MHEVFRLAPLASIVLLPFVGLLMLVCSKLGIGEAARRAERRFLAVLLLMTVVTLRTVVLCEEVWLLHMSALAVLILGALLVPSQDTSVAVPTIVD